MVASIRRDDDAIDEVQDAPQGGPRRELSEDPQVPPGERVARVDGRRRLVRPADPAVRHPRDRLDRHPGCRQPAVVRRRPWRHHLDGAAVARRGDLVAWAPTASCGGFPATRPAPISQTGVTGTTPTSPVDTKPCIDITCGVERSADLIALPLCLCFDLLDLQDEPRVRARRRPIWCRSPRPTSRSSGCSPRCSEPWRHQRPGHRRHPRHRARRRPRLPRPGPPGRRPVPLAEPALRRPSRCGSTPRTGCGTRWPPT